MMKSRTKNLIIALIVVLISISVFFLSKKPSNPEVLDTAIDTEIINIEQIPEEQKTQTINDKNIQSETIKPSVELVQKFNTEMALGRAAVLKKDDSSAIYHYNKALTYQKDSTAYAGLYTVYLNQKNWTQALDSVDSAIKIAPVFGDYWNWKILIMSEGMNKSYPELKMVYDTGYPQIRTQEKVNFVTYFARLSENKGYKSDAISLWQKAIEIYPTNKTMYQAEIDRLKKI